LLCSRGRICQLSSFRLQPFAFSIWTALLGAQCAHIAVTSILQDGGQFDPHRRGRCVGRVDDSHGFWRWRRLGDVPGLRNACTFAALLQSGFRPNSRMPSIWSWREATRSRRSPAEDASSPLSISGEHRLRRRSYAVEGHEKSLETSRLGRPEAGETDPAGTACTEAFDPAK
jgi:hypothetical protein